MYSLYSKKINNFPKGNEWYFLILLSLLGIVLNTAFFTKGLELTTPAHASLISCMIEHTYFMNTQGILWDMSLKAFANLNFLVHYKIENLTSNKCWKDGCVCGSGTNGSAK